MNVFDKAIEAIGTYGHRKSHMGNKNDGMCLLGALSYAEFGYSHNGWKINRKTAKILAEIIAEQNPNVMNYKQGNLSNMQYYLKNDPVSLLWRYNDMFCTGGDEAIVMLEKASIKYEETRGLTDTPGI